MTYEAAVWRTPSRGRSRASAASLHPRHCRTFLRGSGPPARAQSCPPGACQLSPLPLDGRRTRQ
eukprot:scaffold32828_cov112-Isochrysis_galbana.AAC.1